MPQGPQSNTPWAALALLALPAALLAIFQLGVVHPDEVFQALEPAQRSAFGDGVMAWEWRVGLRNWAVSGLLGVVLQVCAALGIEDPQARRAALELPQYALHVAMLGAVYRHAYRSIGKYDASAALGGGLALLSTALVALHAPVLHFAGRTLSESISTALVIWGLERCDDRAGGARTCALAGWLLGCAVIARYASAVIALSVPLWLLGARRHRDAGWVVGGGAMALAVLAVLDWRTWGAPLHSVREYLSFNLISGRAGEAFGTAPFWYYAPWLLFAAPPWIWPAVIDAFRCSARVVLASGSLMLCCAGTYWLAICCVSHKEPRFLYPVLVLVATAAAPAWVAMPSASRLRWRCRVGLSLGLGVALIGLRTPFGPLHTAEYRLFVDAAREGNGIVSLTEHMSYTPAQFYAARTPLRVCAGSADPCFEQAMADPRFDHVMDWDRVTDGALRAHGFVPIVRLPSATLWRR
jgi:GPI mannosyltransferase 3